MQLSSTRRRALQGLAAFVAGSPLLRSQQDPFREHARIKGLYEMEDAFDFEPVAFAKLPRVAYDYTAYGVGSEFTLRRNRTAFDWVDLIPAAAASAQSSIDTTLTLLGMSMQYPIMVAPTANHGQLHADAEMATHRGATAASNTTMIVSGNATLAFDKIAPAATGPLWLQLYPREDLAANRPILEGAQAAGAKAVVVTIDQQASVYERPVHDRNLSAPQRAPGSPAPVGGGRGGGGGGGRGGAGAVAMPNPYRMPQGRLWYEWKFFDQIRPWVKVPMIAKGVLTAEDAVMCLDHGVDAIYVSNHGGRSLDYGGASLEAVPEIVAAVRGRVPVILDSGIRRGSDVLKALAMGVNAVAVGRAVRWGLAAYGPEGVTRVLEILQAELKQAMMLTGRTNLASINKSIEKVNFV